MRASELAYATLRDAIQNGELEPGTVIGEVEQSARLGISRTPMREAIARLIADGLLAQVSPRVVAVTGFDVDDIRDLFVARRALEEASARIAAKRGDPLVFRGLASDFRAAHPETGEHAADAYYALIARFDEAVDRAADNAYLTQALGSIRTHLVRARHLARDNHERLLASVGEHALIAAAIADGDADLAAHATHVHLHHALGAILNSIEATEPRSCDSAQDEKSERMSA